MFAYTIYLFVSADCENGKGQILMIALALCHSMH